MGAITQTQEKLYTQGFMRFGGVDFTSAPTQVAAHRSPDACNMIANEKFFPIKRPGYESVRSYGAPVYGLHKLAGDDDMVHILTHAGGHLYFDDSMTPVYTQMAQARSRSFVMNGRLYILDGGTFLQVRVSDGVCTAEPVSNSAFIPTTSIARTPQGAGTAFEAVNLLTQKRRNSFNADGQSTVFQLDITPVHAVEAVVLNNEPRTDYTLFQS